MPNWKEDLASYVKGIRTDKPIMPIAGQVGYFFGNTIGLVAEVVTSIPGVQDFADGIAIGKMGMSIKISRRRQLKAAERIVEEQVLSAIKDGDLGIKPV